MKFQRVIDAMENIAPLRYAEPWDRVGLLIGSASTPVAGPVLLTIDLTEAVLAEGIAVGACGVIAYHPPIWDPLARVTDATARERIVGRALAAHLPVYSPHTALDAAPGGLTDFLCQVLSSDAALDRIAGDCRALTPHAPPASLAKITTFVPEDALDRVRSALATAGAGRIGEYSLCSFSVLGTGTFLAGEHARPALGQVGRLERAAEHRLEMVCPRAGLAIALATLRQFHPYEEPAIDVVDLVPAPERGAGAGRRLVLDQPASPRTLAQRLKTHLGLGQVLVAPGSRDAIDRPVTHVGVCAGSGAGLAQAAHDNACEVYVTGEIDHHKTLAALARGTTLIVAGHTNTERGYLPRLARRLSELVSDARFVVSTADADPFAVV